MTEKWQPLLEAYAPDDDATKAPDEVFDDAMKAVIPVLCRNLTFKRCERGLRLAGDDDEADSDSDAVSTTTGGDDSGNESAGNSSVESAERPGAFMANKK